MKKFFYAAALLISASIFPVYGDDSNDGLPASFNRLPPDIRMIASQVRRNSPEEFNEIVNAARQVRQSNPEEFDAILELYRSNPQEAMQRGMALAQRSGVALPNIGGMPGGGWGGMNPPEAYIPETMSSPRNARKENMEKAENAIKEQFPEEYAKLEELRKTDPEEARYLFRELASRIPGLIISGPAVPPAGAANEFSAGAPPARPENDGERPRRRRHRPGFGPGPVPAEDAAEKE